MPNSTGNRKHRSSTQRSRAAGAAASALWATYTEGLRGLGVDEDPRVALASDSLPGLDGARQAAAQRLRATYLADMAKLRNGGAASNDDAPSERNTVIQLRHYFTSYRKPEKPLLSTNRAVLRWNRRALELVLSTLDKLVGHIWPDAWPALDVRGAEDEAASVEIALDANAPAQPLAGLGYTAQLSWAVGLYDYIVRAHPSDRLAALTAVNAHLDDKIDSVALVTTLVGLLPAQPATPPQSWEDLPEAAGIPEPAAPDRATVASCPALAAAVHEADSDTDVPAVVAVEPGSAPPVAAVRLLCTADIPPVPTALNDDALVVRCQEHCLRRACSSAMHLMVELEITDLVLVGPTGADLTALGNYLAPMGAKRPRVTVDSTSWHTTVLPPSCLKRHDWLTHVDSMIGPRVVLVCCGLSSLTGLGGLHEAQAVVSCEPAVRAHDKTWPRTARESQSYSVRADNSGRLTLTPRGFCGPERVLYSDVSPYLNSAVTLGVGPVPMHFAVELVTSYYVTPEHKAPDAIRAPVAVVLALKRVEQPVVARRIHIPDADSDALDPAHHHALSGFVGNGDGKRYLQNTMQAMLKQHGTITTASWDAHMAKAESILQTVAPSIPTVNQWAGFSHALCDPSASVTDLAGRATTGVLYGLLCGVFRGLGTRAAAHTGWALVSCLLAVLAYLAPLGVAYLCYRLPYAGFALTMLPRVFVAAASATGVGTALYLTAYHSRWWLVVVFLSVFGGVTACDVVPGHHMLANDYHALVAQTQNCTALFPPALYNATETAVAVSRCFPIGTDGRNAGLFAAMCVACGGCVPTTPPECYNHGHYRLTPTVTGAPAPHCNRTDGHCWFCPVDVPISANRGVVAIARASAVGRHLTAEIGYRVNRSILLYREFMGNYTALIVKVASEVWEQSLFAFSRVVFFNGTTFGVNYTLTGADVIDVVTYAIRRGEDGYRAISPGDRPRPTIALWAVAAVAVICVASQQSSSTVRKGTIDEREATWKHMVCRPSGLYRLAGAAPNSGLVHTTPLCLGAPEPVVGPEHQLRMPNGIQAHCPHGGSHPVLTGIATAAAYAVARCPHNALNAIVNRHCIPRPPPHTALTCTTPGCRDCLATVDVTAEIAESGVTVNHWRAGIHCRPDGRCCSPEIPDLAGRCLACSAHAVPYTRAVKQWRHDASLLRRLLCLELTGADAAWAARLTAAGLARLEDAALIEHTIAWLVKAFTKTEVNLYPPTKARLIQGYGQPAAQLVHAVLTFAIQHVAAQYHNGPDAPGYGIDGPDDADTDTCVFGCGLTPTDLAALPAALTRATDGAVDCPRHCDCYCHCGDIEDAHVRCRCLADDATWVEMDCSNYDAHNSAMHFWASWVFYYCCVTGCLAHAEARSYLQYVIDCFAVVTTYRNDETTFRVHVYGTTKSGHNDTSLGNTLRGIAMWLEAAGGLRQRLGCADGETAIRFAVAQAGDDSIARVRSRSALDWTQPFALHGMKTKVATWANHYDASFLSAVWAATPSGDVFVSKPGRLLAKLFWTHPFRGSTEEYARRHAASVALGVLPTGRLIPGIRQLLQRVWDLGRADVDVSTYLRWNPMVAAWDPAAYGDDAAWPWVQARYGVTQDELDEFTRLVVSARTGDIVACEFTRKVMLRDLPDAPDLDDALDDVLTAGEVNASAATPF